MNTQTGKIYSEDGSEKLSLNQKVSINFKKLSDAPDIKKYLKKQIRLEEYSKISVGKNSLTKKANSSAYQQSHNDSTFTINTIKKGSSKTPKKKRNFEKKSKSVIAEKE